MKKELRNERQAFKALAREAGAAEVRRMADGTLACCGRSGQLAEPMEYDDGTGYDPRYEYVACPSCGQRYQRIDFRCAAHALTCSVDRMQPTPCQQQQARARARPEPMSAHRENCELYARDLTAFHNDGDPWVVFALPSGAAGAVLYGYRFATCRTSEIVDYKAGGAVFDDALAKAEG